MSTPQARKFSANVDWEEDICPPGCTIDHDDKWRGVTVPRPKEDKKAKTVPLPLTVPTFYPPKNPQDYGKVVDPPVITAKGLEKHARQFGKQSPATIASCQDLANMFGFTVKLPKAEQHPSVARKRKSRGQSKKDQAIHLVRMGIKDWTVIEDQLNLSRPMSIKLKEEILGGESS